MDRPAVAMMMSLGRMFITILRLAEDDERAARAVHDVSDGHRAVRGDGDRTGAGVVADEGECWHHWECDRSLLM